MSPLKSLMKKDCSWEGGHLPPDNLQAFKELQSYLCSELIVDYPRKTGPMHSSLMPAWGITKSLRD
jgi:hypothetical protein